MLGGFGSGAMSEVDAERAKLAGLRKTIGDCLKALLGAIVLDVRSVYPVIEMGKPKQIQHLILLQSAI